MCYGSHMNMIESVVGIRTLWTVLLNALYPIQAHAIV